MTSTYKERYHHLHRVLYKKHNRIIAISIPSELASSSIHQYDQQENDDRDDGDDDTNNNHIVDQSKYL